MIVWICQWNCKLREANEGAINIGLNASRDPVDVFVINIWACVDVE